MTVPRISSQKDFPIRIYAVGALCASPGMIRQKCPEAGRVKKETGTGVFL